MYPNFDKILSKVDSRFTLVILVAKRARQINDYLNSMKRQELPRVRGPEIEMIHAKPLTIALKEVEEGRISYRRVTEGIK